ncbi:MAG: Ig-like domain-containing protein, partial [Bacillota bacterium]|nr:Ig-like domain-containing protein [Bacillota bacterium]
AETIAAPTGSLLFLTDAVGKRIQVADLNASTLMTAGMPYKPHSLTWGDGVLLAALSTPEVEADLLAVLDPASGRIIKIIPVNTEIGHLATDGVHAFVCGSARMQSYDLSSGSRLSESYTSSVYDMQYNPAIGMLYTTGYNSSNAYRVIDGALSYLDSSTERANSITVMPDGRQLLLDNGVVLTCSDQAETNLEYVTRIQGGSLVKADPANNEVYVVSERLVNVYAGEDLAFRRVVPQPRETEMLFVSDSRLIIAEEEAGSLLVFRQSGSRTMLQSVKIDGDYCSELYPLQQTIAGPELPYAVSSVLVSAEAAFPGSTLSGDIGSVPLAVGENNLTINVSDPLSGDSRTYTLTVTRLDSDPLPPAVDARSNLGFTPLDIALDPERPVAYLTAPSSRILYRVNLETGEVQTKTFSLTAERLVVKNGKIYLTLLRSGHQNWDNTYLNGYGAVAVIDTATFRTEFIFNTNIDPYDIAADEAGHVFLAPGSNQHSILAAYASQSGQFCSSIGSVYFKSWLDRNPISGKLYTISTNLIPRDIDAFEVSDGLITVNYDSPYHGNYEMYTLMRVSPDGQLIFNGSGNLFTSTPTQSGDMVYAGTLGSTYTSLAFDLAHNRFYTGDGKTFKGYAYDSKTLLWSFTAADDFITMEHDGSQAVAVQKKSSGEHYIRTFAPETLLSTLNVGGSAVAGFNPLTQTYTLNVAADISSLSLSAVALEGSSQLNGDLGMVSVNPGANTFRVTVNGILSGQSRDYTLQVNRSYIPVTGVWLNYGAVNFPVGNSMAITANILPGNATDPRVTWSSSDSNIASVSQSGIITGLAAGDAVITACTTDGGFTSSCTVHILPALLFAADYQIDSTNHVLKDISINTSVDQLKTHLSNNPELLKVYDASGNEYTGDQVASGMTLKLVIGGKVCDQLTLSVFGDVSGDGIIDITDILYIRTDILGNYTLQPWQTPAADINRDGAIDITDILYVRAHILGTYTILAK